MSQDQVRCPSCRLVVRFRNGRPDDEWIECPRCGEDIELDDGEYYADYEEDYEEEPVRRRPPSRRGNAAAFDDVFDDRPQRSRPSRSRPQRAYDDYEEDYEDEFDSPRLNSSGPGMAPYIAGAAVVVIMIAGLVAVFLNGGDEPAENDVAKNDNPPAQIAPQPNPPIEQPQNLNPPVRPNQPDPRPNPLPGANAQPNPLPGANAQPQPKPPVKRPEPKPVPAPPQQPPVVAVAGGAKLRYNWQPGNEHAYEFNVTADHGNSISDIRGSSTITVTNDDPSRLLGLKGQETKKGTGTGFVIHPDGYLATCAHVVVDASEIKVRLGGKTYEAVVVAINEDKDLGIIRITASDLPVLALADSQKVELAQAVRVVGYPLTDVLGQNVKVTQGSVAGLIDRTSGRIFQVDASINPGNSGGPVVNNRGEVIGVASAKLTGNVVDAVGFAVPTNDLKTFAESNKVQTTAAAAGGVDLSGPDLARKVTPAIALLEVTMGPGNARKVVLRTSGSFTKSDRPKQGIPRPSFPQTGSDRCQLVVNDKGEILHSEKSTTIPFMLEQMAHVAIEPLASRGQSTWHAERTILLTKRKQSNNPLDPFGEDSVRVSAPALVRDLAHRACSAPGATSLTTRKFTQRMSVPITR